MTLETTVFRKIMDDTKEKAIKEMVILMNQLTRFAHLDDAGKRELATLAWNGTIDLDKTP